MKNYFHNEVSQLLPQVYTANRTHTIGLLSKATGRHLIHPNHILGTQRFQMALLSYAAMLQCLHPRSRQSGTRPLARKLEISLVKICKDTASISSSHDSVLEKQA